MEDYCNASTAHRTSGSVYRKHRNVPSFNSNNRSLLDIFFLVNLASAPIDFQGAMIFSWWVSSTLLFSDKFTDHRQTSLIQIRGIQVWLQKLQLFDSHHNLSLDHEAVTNFRTQKLGHTVEIVEGRKKNKLRSHWSYQNSPSCFRVPICSNAAHNWTLGYPGYGSKLGICSIPTVNPKIASGFKTGAGNPIPAAHYRWSEGARWLGSAQPPVN
jgi:hypothetical protein